MYRTLRILFINYPKDEFRLLRPLVDSRVIRPVMIYHDSKSINLQEIYNVYNLEKFDIIYLARTGPDVLGDLRFLIEYDLRIPLIYGIWEPTLIKRPYRPTNYIYNVKNLMKLLILATKKNITYHVQNTFEYKIYKFVSKDIFLIPPCVDKFVSSVKDKKFTISFIYAEYRKGADIAFKVLDLFFKKFDNVKANIIVGRGYLKSLFQALHIKHGDKVNLYDSVSRETLYNLLSTSHILIFPSRWEVFGRVVLESFACGTPVVAFDIPGAPHDILKLSGCSYVARPFDIDDFIKGILYFYYIWRKDPTRYKNISSRCLEIAQKYECKRVSKLMKYMFYKVLQNY